MIHNLKYIFTVVILSLVYLTACNTTDEKPVPEPVRQNTEERPVPQAGIQSIEIDPQTHEREVIYLSDVYDIKDIYKSMKGPYTETKLNLENGEEPELLWITGYSAEMVEPDGQTKMSQEFMCHSNLDMDSKTHRQLFQSRPRKYYDRIFTLSQGQYEVEFPKGFGLPILSPEELSLTTQVLNLNHKNPDIQTRHKVKITYVRDSDLEKPMVPLMQISAIGLKRLEESQNGYFNRLNDSTDQHGDGCLVGENAGMNVIKDGQRRKYTGHWVVKPGLEVNNTLVTDLLKVPYDTDIHYIAVHLHPFAESLELKDLTTGKTVFRSNVKNSEGKIGLDHVDYFSSEEGIRIHKDHEYQMVSRYNNTSDEDSDSMAVMYLYIEDREFKKPTPEIANIFLTEPSSKESEEDM